MRASALLGLLAACSSASHGPAPREVPTPPAPAGSAAPGEASAEAPVSPEAPRDVRFDLVSLLHTADVRTDGALLVDLGGPEGAKHVLGGWRTGWGREGEEGGARFLRAGDAQVARVQFGSDVAGPARLVIRAKGIGTTRLRVHLSGTELPAVRIPDGAWGTIALDAPQGLRVGENDLLLRFGGVAEVDWIRIGPSATDAAPVSVARDHAVAIPGGTSISWSLEVPARAELDFGLSGEGGAMAVDVVARRDGAEPRTLLETRTSPGAPSRRRVDLSALGGDVVRLDVVAEGPAGATAVLTVPRVTIPAARPATERKVAKNVLVVLVDTLRADKLRPYRPDSRVEAPTLERIANEGVVFERAAAQENWTKPSVATLLSSLYPSQHNAKTTEAVVPSEVELMSERLRDANFSTACFIANGYVSERFGFNQGWQFYRNYVRQGLRNRAESVARDVLDWLDRRPADRRFFMYVHTIDPHVPYSPPREFVERYDPTGYAGRIVGGETAQLLEDIKVGRFHPGRRDIARLEALYDGEVTYHDVHFAAMIEGLRSRGLLDDTLVIVTADHGEEFFDHGSVGHGHNLHQELLHVPLLMRMPGLAPAGGRVTDDVGLIDVLPTAMDALGLAVPEDLQGRSLVPLLEGRTPAGHSAVLSDFLDGQRAVTAGRYKLIQRGMGPHVYDVLADPTEQTDLGTGKPIVLRHLRNLLGQLVAGAGTGDGRSARPRRVFRRQTTTIDPETDAQLRALGYMQ